MSCVKWVRSLVIKSFICKSGCNAYKAEMSSMPEGPVMIGETLKLDLNQVQADGVGGGGGGTSML
jgi:hypothetical protein